MYLNGSGVYLITPCFEWNHFQAHQGSGRAPDPAPNYNMGSNFVSGVHMTHRKLLSGTLEPNLFVVLKDAACIVDSKNTKIFSVAQRIPELRLDSYPDSGPKSQFYYINGFCDGLFDL